MKLINEKGKLFGIINVVDLLILLAVLLVAGGIGWRILGPKLATAAAPDTKVVVTMRVRGAHPRQLAEIEKNIPAQLVSGDSFVSGASVVKVDSEPYIVQTPTATGEIKEATDPTRIDILFAVEANAPASGAVTKIGTQEVRAGRDFTIKTRYIEQVAIIETVSYANEKEQ